MSVVKEETDVVMKKMIFEIDEKLDKKFRETVVKRKGLHKGVIKESLEEAIKQWIESHPESK